MMKSVNLVTIDTAAIRNLNLTARITTTCIMIVRVYDMGQQRTRNLEGYDKKQYIQDLQIYKQWLLSASSNSKDLEETKRAMGRAIQIMLTDTQRLYLMEYYFNGLNMREIGEKYNKNKSVISKTMKRAKMRLKLILSFCSPALLKATIKEYDSE